MANEDVKMLNLRRDDRCSCGTVLARGTHAGWHRVERRVVCPTCLAAMESDCAAVDMGVPGRSLEREYVRRVESRERRVMERHPRLGRLLLAISKPPPTTEAFAIGAEGEREVAELLMARTGDSVLYLFNRMLGPGSAKGDIDVIAIAPSGVVLIDPKKYRRRRVRVTRARDAFVIDGRRRTSMVTGMRSHLTLLEAAVSEGPVPSTPVSGAYCFLGADLPWRSQEVDGVPILGIRGTHKLLDREGDLSGEDRKRMHRYLAERFPCA